MPPSLEPTATPAAARSREGEQAPAPIAIVGMSCRFPGGNDPDAFHRALIEQRDLFSPPPRERWSWCDDDGITVPRVGTIAGAFGFDCAAFRISPREAEAMDPHQRLMLEQTLLAIEDAGYAPSHFGRRTTGVFVAMYSQDFRFYAASGDWDEISRIYLATGSAHSLVPNRVSYVFDLRGPSELVDTACSSGLVAVHRAVQAIRNGECEQAIVGGVSLLLEPGRLVMLQELGLLSPSGRCAPFDREPCGQVLGEGAAALVLKPLDAALRDRDTIHAVIAASGVNHQGAASGGLTRPSAAAQADLIRRTCEAGRIDPSRVDYVEAHGNGGAGDLSELLAFQDVFSPAIPVGSVKGNIGFLEAAGGLSQIVKVAMAMRHGTMPATHGHRAILEDDELRPGGCRIVSRNTPLGELQSDADAPFMAAVHAYGLGGCNAHVLISGPGPASTDAPTTAAFPILVSADKPEDLAETAAHLLQRLEQSASPVLADIAFTLAAGRTHRTHRLAFRVSSVQELAARLRSIAGGAGEDVGAGTGGLGPDDAGEAVAQWLDGADIDWQALLPHGRRIPLAPAPLRRRDFPLPPLRRR